MFLSFIVPVHNTEKYLAECLDSLLCQDIPAKDYEIICIDDGSTDSSPDILDRYARENPNIYVCHQQNRGVCSARNAGLRVAKGNYVWYMDDDDFISENCLATLQRTLEKSKCDRLVIEHFVYYFEDEAPDAPMDLRKNTSWKDSVVWRNIFRRAFLLENNLYFHYPELSYGEDAMYMYEVKRAQPMTVELELPVHYHRVRPDSLSVAANDKRLKCTIREAQIMKGYYEQGGVLEVETANRFMSFLWGALYGISAMPAPVARNYLKKMKEIGLYPYKKPQECTIVRCPEVKREDWIGKMIDTLYTNLGSPWAYRGMRLVHLLFQMKQSIRK